MDSKQLIWSFFQEVPGVPCVTDEPPEVILTEAELFEMAYYEAEARYCAELQ